LIENYIERSKWEDSSDKEPEDFICETLEGTYPLLSREITGYS